MQAALRVATTVHTGVKIEFSDPQLLTGDVVDVIVLLQEPKIASRPSILNVLAEAPGHLLFHTQTDVDDYLREEREAWER